MERSEATYESYDGVAFELEGGFVVRCNVLTVSEALGFLRMMSSVESDFSAHYRFMQEFPDRIKLAEASLADLGVTLDRPGGPLALENVTVRQATGLLGLLGDAEHGDPNAQYDFLDRFPAALAIDPEHLSPFDTFELGRALAEQVYSLIYGIARRFWLDLTTSPGARMRTQRATASPSALRGSTT